MASSVADLIAALPDGDGWGPPVTSDTTLEGVPYAPFSKGDKLGRMADWTADSKDGRDGRGGRAQYNRNYRGAWAQRRDAETSALADIYVFHPQNLSLTVLTYRSASLRRGHCVALLRPGR